MVKNWRFGWKGKGRTRILRHFEKTTLSRAALHCNVFVPFAFLLALVYFQRPLALSTGTALGFMEIRSTFQERDEMGEYHVLKVDRNRWPIQNPLSTSEILKEVRLTSELGTGCPRQPYRQSSFHQLSEVARDLTVERVFWQFCRSSSRAVKKIVRIFV
jgi:hypothetical protein